MSADAPMSSDDTVSADDTAEVEIRVNGEPRRLPQGSTVEDLVRSLGRDLRTVAVEYNGEILRRAGYGSTRLETGDRIEIVHFVQGG